MCKRLTAYISQLAPADVAEKLNTKHYPTNIMCCYYLLHFACEHNILGAVKLLIDNGRMLIEKVDTTTHQCCARLAMDIPSVLQC